MGEIGDLGEGVKASLQPHLGIQAARALLSGPEDGWPPCASGWASQGFWSGGWPHWLLRAKPLFSTVLCHWPSTYATSVLSQRRCTLSQPACLINDAVAHMQMHHESPGLGGATIRSDHWNAFCPVRSQKSPVPHLSGACDTLSISCAQTLCVPS